jgi:hypothetical protein
MTTAAAKKNGSVIAVPRNTHDVVAQVEFERHTLKPGFAFKRKGLETVASSQHEFNLHHPTTTAPP